MNKQWLGIALCIALTPIGGITQASVPADSQLNPPTLSVRGEARVAVPADKASFSVGVQNRDDQAKNALQENSRRMQRLRKALLKAGVDPKAIQTGAFSVQPQWQPRPRNADADWQPKIIGYQANAQLKIETDQLDKLAEFLQAGIDAGANKIGQLRFSLKDSDEAYQQALQLATRKALQHAQVAADAAGVKLGSVYQMDVDTQSPRQYEMMQAAPMARMAADVAMPVVEPGEIDIHAGVQMLYRIEP